jgi:hypothetical protein
VYLTNLAIFDTLYLIFMLTLSLIHCRDTGLDASNYYYIPYGRVINNDLNVINQCLCNCRSDCDDQLSLEIEKNIHV